MIRGGKTKKCNIKVIIRARPASEQENKSTQVSNLQCTPKKVTIDQSSNRSRNSTKTFTFDSVFDQNTSQRTIFSDAIVPVLDDVLQGFNCTVFAYGQTGTGKTYTMEGNTNSAETTGIIPRSLNFIFDSLIASGAQSFVKVSFLELHNEELNDLLSDEDKVLRIYDQQKSRVLVHNLEQVSVSSSPQALDILMKGIAKRMVAETKLNKASSRSHCIFTITIHMKEVSDSDEEILKVGTLNLVDLAGSECVGRSGAVDARAKEAGMINTSLLTLGRVISALVDRSGYIPYRDSKLTRLLQESLGGKAKTVVIATISPFCNEETLSTLEYAHRAKKITNKPVINQKVSQKKIMSDMISQIANLRRDNQALREKNGIFLPPEKYDRMNEDLKVRAQRILDVEAELDGADTRYSTVQSLFSKKTEEWGELKTANDEIQNQLSEARTYLEVTKKDFKEQKYLVQEHIQNELVLHNQANELKENLEESIRDNSELFKKIDRVKSDSKHNKDVTEVFKQQVVERLEGIEKDVSEFNTSITERNKEHQEKVLSLMAGESSLLETLKSELVSFQSKFSSQESEMSTEVGEHVKKVLDILKNHNDTLERGHEEFEQSAQRIVEKQKTELDGILKKLNDQRNMVDSNMKYMSQRMDVVTEGIGSLLGAHLKTLTEARSKITSASDAQMEDVTLYALKMEERTQVMQERQSKIRELIAAQDVDVAEILTSNQTLKNGAGNHAAKLNNACSNIVQGGENIRQWRSDYETSSKQTSVEFTSKCQEQITSLSQLHESVRNHKSSHEQETTALMKHQVLQKNTQTEMANLGLRSCNEFSDSYFPRLRSLSEVTTTFADEQKSSLATSQDHLHRAREQTESHGLFQSKKIQTYANNQNEKNRSIRNQIRNFDYKVTQPTNQTPTKKQHVYPKELVLTKPHSELLVDFRNNVNGLHQAPPESPNGPKPMKLVLDSPSTSSPPRIESSVIEPSTTPRTFLSAESSPKSTSSESDCDKNEQSSESSSNTPVLQTRSENESLSTSVLKDTPKKKTATKIKKSETFAVPRSRNRGEKENANTPRTNTPRSPRTNTPRSPRTPRRASVPQRGYSSLKRRASSQPSKSAKKSAKKNCARK